MKKHEHLFKRKKLRRQWWLVCECGKKGAKIVDV